MEHPHRTPRDQMYIDSTSFEVYLITGFVFVVALTIAFVLSVVLHAERMIWPALIPVVLLSYVVLNRLTVRERLAKIREVDGEDITTQ